jgi:hypothetical protein
MEEFRLQGLDQLVRAINRLKDKTVQKAARAGINAGLAAMNKAIRSAVNASSASPEMKRAARAAIGKRLLKEAQSRSIIAAKGGFGVGLHGKRKRAKAAARAQDRTRRGVGISASNIHWAVLGTRDRFTGTKTVRGNARKSVSGRLRYTKATGNPRHPTGSMPAVLAGIIPSVVSSAGPEIMDAVRRKVQDTLAKEVHASQVPNFFKGR